MTAYDQIKDKVRQLLVGKIGNDEIADLENELCIILGQYEIKNRELGLVNYNDSDLKILQKFFIAKAIQGCTQATVKTYSVFLNQFLSFVKKHIVDITTDDIRLYIAKRKVSKASDSYLATIHRILSSFFSWCVGEEIITKNPMLRVEKIKIRKKIEEALSEEDLEAIRYAAKTKREKALVEFLYSTGCRISEVVNLNKEDIDFDSCEVNVLGKGRKWRKVYLTQRAKFALQDYLNSRQDKSEALFSYDFSNVPKHLLENNIVARNYGYEGRISTSQAEVIVRKIGRRCKLKLHPHLLRKTVATIALRKGMAIDQVRQMLGHESIATTTIYAQTQGEEVKSSHSKFV